MKHTVSLFLLLSAFWLLNSGHYNVLMLLLGAISILFVLFLAHRMDLVDRESQPLHLTARMPGYYFWLMKQIIIANFGVLKCIWSIKPKINPGLYILKARQKTDMGKVIYANSITLTPGTVTVNLQGDSITVHALTQQFADNLATGIMHQRVLELEE